MLRPLVIASVLAGCGGGPSTIPGDGSPPGDSTGDGPPGPAGKRVFVSSMNTNANLAALGGGATGVEGADNMCNNFAGAAGLGGEWQAWISDSTVDAIDRITGSGPWFRMDGQMAFANKANLTTSPMVPVVIDEKGRLLMFPPDLINTWTGTSAGGRFTPNNATCGDWTDGTISAEGTVGDAGEIDSGWTNFDKLDCDLQGRLYCLER